MHTTWNEAMDFPQAVLTYMQIQNSEIDRLGKGFINKISNVGESGISFTSFTQNWLTRIKNCPV